MRCAVIFALLLFFPTVLNVRAIKWEGKPLSGSISTERPTRIEFPENLRSVFLSRSDIAVEREDRSLTCGCWCRRDYGASTPGRKTAPMPNFAAGIRNSYF